MGRTKLVQKIILEELGQAIKGKSDLKKAVKAKGPSLKKHVTKALKKLVKKGVVEEDGKIFRISSVQIEDSSSSHTQLIQQQQQDDDAIPIAARLRQEQEHTIQKKSVSFADEPVDLDDEIRRLEAELNHSSDGSSDEESSGSIEDGDNPAVLCLSAFADDRIEHLPDTFLPEPGKYKAQGQAVNKKLRKATVVPKGSENRQKIDGLKEAVKEVLSGYKARSSERLPFYCRFCSKQYNDETEFFEHKRSDFHKVAVDLERRATYCRVCQKQLTSPDQMKEHLTSRPHRERMSKVRSRQGVNASGGGKKDSRDGARQWT